MAGRDCKSMTSGHCGVSFTTAEGHSFCSTHRTRTAADAVLMAASSRAASAASTLWRPIRLTLDCSRMALSPVPSSATCTYMCFG